MESKNCSDEHVNWGLCAFVVIAALFVGFMTGLWAMDSDWKVKAVKAGHAKWVVADENGSVSWGWVPK